MFLDIYRYIFSALFLIYCLTSLVN